MTLTDYDKIVYATILGGVELKLPYPSREEVQEFLRSILRFEHLTYEQAAQLLWKENTTPLLIREVKEHYDMFVYVTKRSVFEDVYPEVTELLKP